MDTLSVAQLLQQRGLEVGICEDLQDEGRQQTFYGLGGTFVSGVRNDMNLCARFPEGMGFAIRFVRPWGGSAGYVPFEELSAFKFLEHIGPTLRVGAGLSHVFAYKLRPGQKIHFGEIIAGRLSGSEVVPSFLAHGRVWAGSNIATVEAGGEPAFVPRELADALKAVGRLTFDA